MRARRNPYLVAVLAIAAAWLLRHLLDPFLGDRIPLGFFLVGLAFSAWYAGARAGFLALAMGFMISWYTYLPPRNSFAIPEGQLVNLIALLFVALSVLVILLLLRRAEHNARLDERRMLERENAHAAAQTALQTAHARFWSFVDSLPAQVFIKDEAGRYIFLNEAGHKQLGSGAIGK